MSTMRRHLARALRRDVPARPWSIHSPSRPQASAQAVQVSAPALLHLR